MLIHRALVIACCVVLISSGLAKDKKEPKGAMVMLWPNTASPTLKLTFEKFMELGAYNGQLSLESNVLIENMSTRFIPQASFTVFLLNKDNVRVGSGTLNVSDLGPAQQAKVAFQVFSVGVPASLSLAARNNAAGIPTSLKTVGLKVISVPPGAGLKVDGRDAGVTPALVYLTIGNHALEFSKEGFAPSSTPVEIKPDDEPGGSITVELGGISRDSVELRDGRVLQGDVISMTMTLVVVRVDGKDETLDRNQVKKIILVQRETSVQPAVVQPAPNPPTNAPK